MRDHELTATHILFCGQVWQFALRLLRVFGLSFSFVVLFRRCFHIMILCSCLVIIEHHLWCGFSHFDLSLLLFRPYGFVVGGGVVFAPIKIAIIPALGSFLGSKSGICTLLLVLGFFAVFDTWFISVLLLTCCCVGRARSKLYCPKSGAGLRGKIREITADYADLTDD